METKWVLIGYIEANGDGSRLVKKSIYISSPSVITEKFSKVIL